MTSKQCGRDCLFPDCLHGAGRQSATYLQPPVLLLCVSAISSSRTYLLKCVRELSAVRILMKLKRTPNVINCNNGLIVTIPDCYYSIQEVFVIKLFSCTLNPGSLLMVYNYRSLVWPGVMCGLHRAPFDHTLFESSGLDQGLRN